LEAHDPDWWLVYAAEGSPQALGVVFEHGTYINEPAYSWATGTTDRPTGDGEGVEPTREEAVAAVLRASAAT
jgi:hypothetical protein